MKRFMVFGLLLVLALIFLFPTTENIEAKTKINKGCKVVLYAQENFMGVSEIFYSDKADLRSSIVGNDMVRSVRLDKGCYLILYKDRDFRGLSTTIVKDTPSLKYTLIGNGAASSLKIKKNSPAQVTTDLGSAGSVTLYVEKNYRGVSQTFYADKSDLRSSFIGNDKVSSVRVDGGCQVVLFEHSDYRGKSATITKNTSSLRNTVLGNNAASSLRIIFPERNKNHKKE